MAAGRGRPARRRPGARTSSPRCCSSTTATLGLGTGTLEALFGVYAIGLIPGLLIGGPLSDARGRRAVVMPAAVLSLVASVALAAAGHHVGLLFAGRLLAGVSSGAVFSAGTAWLRELSAPAAQPAGTPRPAARPSR